MCEEVRFTVCTCVIALTIFGAICFGVWQSYALDHAAIKAGLHQQQALGSEKILWVK